MVFGRRKPREWWQHLRYAVWPRTGWERAFRYLGKRVLRLSATPHAIALGFACGIFASFTPFIGLHFVIAAILAFLVRGNVLASAFGTVVGNPVTFPLIWGATFQLGNQIMGLRSAGSPENLDKVVEPSLSVMQSLWPATLKPMLVGAVPIGLFFAVLSYLVLRASTAAYQRKRRARLARRMEMKQAEQEKRTDRSFEYATQAEKELHR